MKDFTTTSFGLVIAYLLPGFLALYGASSWSESLKTVIRTMLSGDSDAALVIAVAAFSLVCGLFVNSLRWLVFERTICTDYRVPPSVLAALREEPKLKAFLMVIEETFRYHQFYGSIAVLLPMLCLAFLRQFNVTFTNKQGFIVFGLLALTLEIAFAVTWHKKAHLISIGKWPSFKVGATSIGIAPFLFFITPAVYLFLLFSLGYFDEPGMFRVSVLLLMLILGGLTMAANSIAALRRYSERIQNLV